MLSALSDHSKSTDTQTSRLIELIINHQTTINMSNRMKLPYEHEQNYHIEVKFQI